MLALAGLLIAVLHGVLATPTYEARADVQLRTDRSEDLFTPIGLGQRQAALRNPTAELEYLDSADYREALSSQDHQASIDWSYRFLAKTQPERSNLLVFIARAPDEDAATMAAEAAAVLYLDERHNFEQRTVEDRLLVIGDRHLVLAAEVEGVRRPLASAEQALAGETDPISIAALTAQVLLERQSVEPAVFPLETELRNIETEQVWLARRLELLETEDLSARLHNVAGDARLVGPLLWRNTALALVLGALGGLFVASLKAEITSEDELRELLPNIPILVQPRPGTTEIARFAAWVARLARQSPDDRLDLLLVPVGAATPAVAVFASETAVAISADGLDVGLVEADLGQPSAIATHAAVGRRIALLDALKYPEFVNDAASDESVSPTILFGGQADDGFQLLRSIEMYRVLQALRRHHDITIVTSASLSHYSEAEAVLTHEYDHVVVVVECGVSRKSDIIEAVERIKLTTGGPLGCVLIPKSK